MEALELARWQFGITTVYHFLFVPLTIGLAPLVAIMQTVAYRTDDERWWRLTKLFGKLLLINFAMGVVTGIVQEFQFGMNWSSYSRFVGDIFGAPLAIEGLAAFFLESTFLGLWIFGWRRMPRGLHLATIWLVALGTWASAYFILAANSWMQNPVGYAINEEVGRAELQSIGAVLTNANLGWMFAHTIVASLATAGFFVLAVAAYHMLKGNDVSVFRGTAAIGLITALGATGILGFTGHEQAQLKTDLQPMKIAAAEAQYETESPASWSVFAIGSLDGEELLFDVRVPYLLSVLATNSLDGEVEGINDLQSQAVAEHGEGDYTPNIPVAYWTFRVMIGLAMLMLAFGAYGLWQLRRGRLESSTRYLRYAIPMAVTPFVASSAGWIFTEMGRQPWVVQDVLLTADGVSPSVSLGEVALSLAGYTAIYTILLVVNVGLILKYARQGLGEERSPEDVGDALQY